MKKNDEIVLHSGCANGADYEWVKNALAVDPRFRAEIHSFYGHNYRLPGLDLSRIHIRVHSFSSLMNEALPVMHRVANGFNRQVPFNEYARNLILRNYYQVRDSEYVFAVAKLSADRRHVQGGTGWAVEVAKFERIPILVFDEWRERWFSFSFSSGVFVPCRGNPPYGFIRDLGKTNITGIGTREITPVGIKAIKSIL